MIILFAIFVAYVCYSAFFRNNTTTQKEGIFLDCDMVSKLQELMDDPTMTDAKWRQWLPVFEAADREIRVKCPHLQIGRNADVIRKILDDDYEVTSL